MSIYHRIVIGRGRDQAPSGYQRRRRGTKSTVTFGGSTAGRPALGRVADRESLIDTYYGLKSRGGHAPGRDRVTYADLGPTEVAQIMGELAKAIHSGTYRPGPARKLAIPKPSGRGTRTLSIRNVADRAVSAALLKELEPIFEPSFLAGSHGFRPGRGTWGLLADLGAEMAATGRRILAIDDVRKAFDAVVIADLMGDLREHIEDEGLLTLTEAVARGGEDEDRDVGIAQGDPLSPLLLNVRLHNAHDLPISGDPANPPWYRYADNLCYPCRGVPEGERILDKARHLLYRAGHELKGEDGPPADLRETGARLLGFVLTWKDERLVLRLGEDAWTKLGQDLMRAHEDDHPTSNARCIVEGWIDSFGPAFEGREGKVADRTLGIAAGLGFREIASEETLTGRCRTAHRRWMDTREGAIGHRQSSRPEEADSVAAPPATVAPGG